MINKKEFLDRFDLNDCVVEENGSEVIIDLDEADLFNNVVLALEDSDDFYLEESLADYDFTKFVFNNGVVDVIVSANFNDDKYIVVLREVE